VIETCAQAEVLAKGILKKSGLLIALALYVTVHKALNYAQFGGVSGADL
jgi:hypothetical protein